MLSKRTVIWLTALAAAIFMAGRAMAQPAHSNLSYPTPHPTYEHGSAPFAVQYPGKDKFVQPFHPVGFEPKMDWFAPAETSTYGRGPRPNIGYFFSYERVFWSLAAPEHAPVGSEINPNIIPPGQQVSIPQFFKNGPSLYNTFINAEGAWGNRWELGYIDTDDYGWLVSVIDHVSQGQYSIDNRPAFFLGDPNGLLDGTIAFTETVSDNTLPVNAGIVPFLFDEVRLENQTYLNGAEVSRFFRARRLHSGAYFELLYGVRWFQLADTLVVEAEGTSGTTSVSYPGQNINGTAVDPVTVSFPTNILDASFWSLRTQNNLIGPQIGMRFFKQRGRWVTSASARFLAAANFQNLHMKTNLGTNTIANQAASNSNFFTDFVGIGSERSRYTTTFSPLGELRVDVAYNVTRAVGLKVGYTGMVVGNVSRASTSIDYNDPNLIGIRDNNFNEIFFVNGINFGFEINR